MNLKRLRRRFGVPAALMAFAMCAFAAPAGAPALGLGETEEFFAPTQPTKPLTAVEGPDGNVWYTNDGSTKIGKVTPSGEVSEYSPGLTGAALSITAGPDGDIWFTEKTAKKIGHIDPSEPATSLVECSVTNEPEFITAGPDGNLWFTSFTAGAKSIGRLTPACVETMFGAGLNAGANPISIIPGPDGNLWFGDIGTTKAVGKITPSGTITEYAVVTSGQNRPHSIAVGSDERIWFAAQKSTEEKIGAITTEGVITYYKTPTVPVTLALNGFATGADGNVWARETSNAANEKQKITLKTSGPEDLGGTYKLIFMGEETEALAFNAAGVTVEEKLGALPSIGGIANVKLTDVFTGGALVERTVEFEGKFARTDVSAISCDGSGLTGTSPSCSLEQAATALPHRLYRFQPNGESTVFLLEPRETPALLTTNGKMGTLVPGPDNSLWFTTAGDPSFVSTPAIGKFGLGIESKTLTVSKEGTGDGIVVSNPAGIECDPTCSADFTEGEKVTLTASPDSESLFVSWKGCETGGAIGRTCKVTVDKAKTVTAKFIQAYDISVTRVGTGLGKVQSAPSGILCLSNCSTTKGAFKELTSVTLTATPSKNYTFTKWTGDCTGESTTCVLSTLEADKAVGAEFTAVPQFNLTLTKTGGGQGTVKAKQAGINCGLTCTSQAAAYFKGAVIELLVPLPGKGSTFGGWSGAGCSGTGTCTVTMSEAKSVTAEFK
jgi:streptogramin lyase